MLNLGNLYSTKMRLHLWPVAEPTKAYFERESMIRHEDTFNLIGGFFQSQK